MDRRAKVELFEQIRREHEFRGASIRAIAQQFQVHRRLVRRALASAVPPERMYSPRVCPRLDAVKPFIEEILQADQKAPRKQRHTAQRIYRRICQELPQYPVGRSRVGEYVRQRKQELGLLGRDTFIPQSYRWGSEGQVDWYEVIGVKYFFVWGQLEFPFSGVSIAVVVRWECGKRESVFQGLWKAVFAFQQSVISTAALGSLGFFFGLLRLLNSVAGDVELENHTVMDKPVDRRRRGHRVLENPFPFGERQVARDENAAALVTFS